MGLKNIELEQQSTEMEAQATQLKYASEELKHQNAELGQQQKQLKNADRLKSEFLSNMSHELRTPLNSVMALSRVLIMQAKDKLSREEVNYLEIIEKNGKQLLSLINDILDLSKIEAGKMDVTPKPFSLNNLIETIVESLTPVAKEKKIEISHNIDHTLKKIESDEVRVHQIIQNIVGNAVKFTSKGSVAIDLSHDETNAYIRVKDTGVGISQEDLPYIFEEFRQIDGSSSRKFEGTGLGLAIAYKAAQILRGNIALTSQLNQGSEFTVRLPILWEGYVPPEPAPIGFEKDNTPLRKKTILIVDDDPGIRDMISEFLINMGYQTLTAASGRQALDLARIHNPMAMTIDIIMPEMDGWELINHLKNDPRTSQIPVIVVSITNDRETGFALGSVGHIAKPVDKDKLIAEIRKLDTRTRLNVLIADDNEMDLTQMSQAIKHHGLETMLARDGRQCLDMINQQIPDLLILDLMMPKMNGFEVISTLRENPLTRNLPVIVVTAKDLTQNEKEMLKGSILSVLTKSDTTPAALFQEIQKKLNEIEHLNNLAHKTILLVEDNESAIIQVRSVLEKEGYSLDIATNGSQAIDYVKTRVPDGIILDLMMPGMDGFEVLETMGQEEATARIPVLILTAKDLTKEDLNRLSTNNVQQLIQKGDVDRRGLLMKIRQMLGLEPEKNDCPRKAGPQTDPLEPEDEKRGTGKVKRDDRATLLVVEDNPDNRLTLKAILKNQYHIIEANDGEDGLEKAISILPDLILLDISLPKMDGFEVVKRIKAHGPAGKIPVIAMTAHAMKGDKERILTAGCDEYVSKPLDPQMVTDTVKRWLQMQR